MAVVTDRAFLPWCAVTLRSCAEATTDARVRFHVLVKNDVSQVERDNLEGVGAAAGAETAVIEIDDTLIAALPAKDPALGGRISWVRILLPELLPDLDRVIYLDADTLVRSSVLPMWDALDGAPIAAVANVTEPAMYPHIRSLGIAEPKDYFNAGVLVIDLAAWRAEGAAERLYELGRRQPLLWFDQDVLNLVFAERWRRLHPRWNAMYSLWWWADHAGAIFSPDELTTARSTPAVLHFEGPPIVKPWHFLSSHPFRHEYRKMWGQSALADQNLHGRTLVARGIALLPEERWLPTYSRLARASDRARAAPASVRRRVINLSAQSRAKARNPRVNTAVAPDENMLFKGTLQCYFETGEDAFEQIAEGLVAAGVEPPRHVLDAPSGYGRVLRYMRAAWPNAEITAMELRPGAPEFCAARFGARPVQSAIPLWSVDGVGDDFDLVWSGSFLTHVDVDAWEPTIAYFRDRLRPGGVLIFTTHGERTVDLLARDPTTVELVRRACQGWEGDYGVADAAGLVARARQTGFAFEDYGRGLAAAWGVSVSLPDWVRHMVEAVGGLTLVRHEPHGWSEHQDVWTYIRSVE